ncbi:HSF-type DNA-binding-domain-containing protein, partial [Amylostereum chailletii]
TNLSLNLSSLSVASPTNLSPINPSPLASTATSGMSPITPISPSQGPNTPHTPFGGHSHHSHSHFHPQQQPQSQFSFAPPDQGLRHGYEDPNHDLSARRIGLSSRSSSASDKSVPRKRSFSSATPLAPSLEEHMFSTDTPAGTPYDEVDMAYPSADPNGSPIDGSGSDQDDPMRSVDPPSASLSSHSLQASSMGIIGKPLGTNNFVTKLYQMINDPKSAHFIAWTELGTSFVVSNVGEFSRSILGSHFKHNNFSSFVRQLNMYGFHKINRTPRAQRTSTDAQTWEFSHHKFLRGRPDLLEEIKRKALEPDPSVKHRVELPGEVAAQLNQMRDENRRVGAALAAERAKVERLAALTKSLYDVVEKNLPGWLPTFPTDLMEPSDSPNIFVTSPNMSLPSNPFPPSLSSAPSIAGSLHSLSPSSSPTTGDFPSHLPHLSQSHTLSRQHSF